jgi:hypothetical protein
MTVPLSVPYEKWREGENGFEANEINGSKRYQSNPPSMNEEAKSVGGV